MLNAHDLKTGPDLELSLASRAAWLSYIGGLRQEDIAARLGISRVKVNRLIALAHKRGMVRTFVEGAAVECVALENDIRRRYGLEFCEVVPQVGDEPLPLPALANGGARFLMRALERQDLSVVGVGHGRTLAAAIDALPNLPRPHIRFVSLLGCLTRNSAANPFDVIHRLTERAGAESYFMPVPFFADSVEDKEVLLAQKSVRDVFELARSAQLSLVGVGELGPRAHMLETGMITPAEYRELAAAGAAGEILGQFVDDEGRPVAVDLNQRAIGLPIEALAGKEVVAIAGGKGKARALRAVLRSGAVTGLITDEATAERMVARESEFEEDDAQGQGTEQEGAPAGWVATAKGR